jgi:hypothetical protein
MENDMTTSLLDQSTVIVHLGESLCSDYARMRARRLGLDEAEMMRLTLHYWHGGESHETALQTAAREMGK